MSYIPSELKLTDGTTNIQLTTIAGGGQLQTTNPTGNMVISTTLSDPANYVALNAPNVAIVSDVLSIVSASQVGIQYTLPTNVQPTNNSILVFEADGSSTFQPNGGSVNAVLNTQYPTPATAGSVLLMSGGDAVSSSPSDAIIANGGEINLTSNSINILRPGFPSGGSLFIDGNDDLQLVNNTNGNYKLTANGTMTVTGGGGVQLVSQNGNTIHINPNGQTIIQSNNPTLFQELTSFKYSSLLQQASGEFSIINENADSSLELRANTGGVLINSFNGLSFNGIGNLNSSGSEIVLSNGDGSLQLSSKFNDVIVDTEGGGKFQVNQGSEFQGDMTINKVEPKINFNNTDYPTQLASIAFNPSAELIMKHQSPDLATITELKLGVSDITLGTNFHSGNINLIPGAGKLYINSYTLPSDQPQNNQIVQFQADGTSAFIDLPASTIPAGLLRAINCNLFEPTEIVDVVWSNLTPAEQLAWKGGDPTIIDPVQSATGNYWNFTKLAPSTNKIGWTIPDDLSALSFQDLQSFWCVIRFNNTTSISTEGSLYLSIQTNPPTGINTFRTRWNYSNPGTPMNQTGYFYKLYALDTITTTTAANFGKGQEVGQTQFKTNPCNVSPDLWSIALNKLVVSPTGDTTAGYTTAPLQSISLQTASNIHTFNFDVVSIGYLNKQYNLHFV